MRASCLSRISTVSSWAATLLGVILDTGREDGQNLLIIRDSYTDCLAPFLLEHFSQIHLLDLRYYRASVAEYVRENEIDQVLVLYGVNTFSTDTDYVLMAW